MLMNKNTSTLAIVKVNKPERFLDVIFQVGLNFWDLLLAEDLQVSQFYLQAVLANIKQTTKYSNRLAIDANQQKWLSHNYWGFYSGSATPKSLPERKVLSTVFMSVYVCCTSLLFAPILSILYQLLWYSHYVLIWGTGFKPFFFIQ